MKVKFNILNMKEFLKVVNTCSGNVYMMEGDGSRTRLNNQGGSQERLAERFRKNKNSLALWLEISEPKDYFSLVSYYAGDC